MPGRCVCPCRVWPSSSEPPHAVVALYELESAGCYVGDSFVGGRDDFVFVRVKGFGIALDGRGQELGFARGAAFGHLAVYDFVSSRRGGERRPWAVASSWDGLS